MSQHSKPTPKGRPLIMCCSGEIVDVRPCDPVNTRTTPQPVCCLPRDDRHERKSTAAPFWFCPTLGPTPELACHPRAVSPRPSRDVATPPPAARAAGWIHRPTPPWWSDPTQRLREHRSVTDDRAASGHSISIPARAPEAQDQQCLAQSVGSALRPARCDHNPHKPAWDERIG